MKDGTFTADRLLALYDRVAEAEDAIPRLRRFVLDLAVRGKLVEQDPTDEPAAELLKRIAKAKARLVKSGLLRATKTREVEMTEAPFDLPSVWSWEALGEIFVYDAGDKRDPKELKPDLWLLELEDVEKETGRIAERLPVSARESLSTKSQFQAGDILYGKLRPYLNKVVVADAPGYSTTEIVAIRPYLPLCSEYCALALRRPDFVEYVTRLGQGTKMPRLRTEDAMVAPFPLPPLAEQQRIVAKVDELMALCDRLQAARAGREAVRDRLTAATLTRLTAPEAGAETFPTPSFQTNARFALQTLPTLTTRPDHIKTLRQTILNLAVRGKLVAQDPTDEPAAELLKRIAEANSRIQKLKGIRGGKAAEAATGFEALGDVPSSWRRTHLQDIAYQITDGTHLTPRYTPTGKPFLSAQNVKPFRFMPDQYRFVSEQDFDGYRANRKPERGDVLLTRVGAGIGEAAVLDSDFEFAFYVSLCLIKVPVDLFLPEYLVIWLNSPEGRASSTLRTYGKGASQGNLNLSMIRTFEIPLPPLAEQHRIVAKVDALMALCDRLEASLTTATTTRSRLLESLLHEALNGALGGLPEVAA